MIWFYIISLVFYLLGFSLRSCLYQTVSGSSRDVPIAKENPKLRKKIPIKIWYIVVGFLFLWIPVANVLASIIFFGNVCPDLPNYEFLMPEENKLINFLYKIGNLLNKNVA